MPRSEPESGVSQPTPSVGGTGRRLSLGVVDQIVASGSNFVAMVLAARLLSVDDFGAFSLAMLTYNVAVGMIRALCGEAILVRPGENPAEIRQRAAASVGSAVMLGILAVPVIAALGLVLGGRPGNSMFVMAAAMPVLMAQDSLRFSAFARRMPAVALVSDLVWLVLMGVGFAVLRQSDSPRPALMVLCWAVPAAVGALASAVWLRLLPVPALRLGWVRSNRDLSVPYLVDFVTGQGSGQMAVYLLAVVASVGAVASIRGAQTLFGPVPILQTGAMIVLVPEMHRSARQAPERVLKVAAIAGAAFAGLGVVVTAALWVLPDSVGTALLGDTWRSATEVLIPVGIAATASGLLAGASIGLRTLAAADAIVRIRLYTTPAIIGLPVLGAVLGDATGGAYGIAGATMWGCGWYWWTIRTEVGRRSAALA